MKVAAYEGSIFTTFGRRDVVANNRKSTGPYPYISPKFTRSEAVVVFTFYAKTPKNPKKYSFSGIFDFSPKMGFRAQFL